MLEEIERHEGSGEKGPCRCKSSRGSQRAFPVSGKDEKQKRGRKSNDRELKDMSQGAFIRSWWSEISSQDGDECKKREHKNGPSADTV